MRTGIGWLRLDLDFRKNWYDKVFICLILVSLVLRAMWLDRPLDFLIFDEQYYVNVARNILGLPHLGIYEDTPSGIDPNPEHPPLAKLMIALSMRVLGDNAWGWRIPSVIFGCLALLLFYLLIKKASKKPALALVSAFLFSFDNLILVHSRIATLDIFLLAFILLGFYWYFSGRMALSAASLALGTLCKMTGILGFGTLVAYHFLRDVYRSKAEGLRVNWWKKIRWLGYYTYFYGLPFLGLLTVFDRFWGTYSNPFAHLTYIYTYTSTLTCPSPTGIQSYPWQWLINEVQIPYLTVTGDVYANGQFLRTEVLVAFTGAMNPFIIYLSIPTMIYSAYKYFSKGDEFALFLMTWFICTYSPSYPMAIIGHRIMYLFYFLITLPSVCAAIGYLYTDQKRLIVLMGSYIVLVIIGFIVQFPFRTIP